MTIDAIGLMADTITDAADSLAEWAREHPDPDECVRVLAVVDDVLQAVRGAKATAERVLVQTYPVGETIRLPGIGQASIVVKGKQRTDGEALARAVAGYAADAYGTAPDGTAVPPGPFAEMVALLVAKVFGTDTASHGFRVGEVKALGLKPGNYREFADSEPSVVFERLG